MAVPFFHIHTSHHTRQSCHCHNSLRIGMVVGRTESEENRASRRNRSRIGFPALIPFESPNEEVPTPACLSSLPPSLPLTRTHAPSAFSPLRNKFTFSLQPTPPVPTSLPLRSPSTSDLACLWLLHSSTAHSRRSTLAFLLLLGH